MQTADTAHTEGSSAFAKAGEPQSGSIELSYKAFEGGQVNVQSVFSTDGQLLGGKFEVLSAPKHARAAS